MIYEDSSSISPTAVERVAAAPRLGLASGGLERARDRPRAGRDTRGREPVAQTGPGRRPAGPAASHAPRSRRPPDRRAEKAVADAVGARRRSVWLAGRRLDHRALAGPSSKAVSEQRTIVWVDESGFYLLAGAVRTYAPRGETPILRVPLTRDHLSVIGGLTNRGRLLLQVRTQPFRGPTIVAFLKH